MHNKYVNKCRELNREIEQHLLWIKNKSLGMVRDYDEAIKQANELIKTLKERKKWEKLK